MCKEQNVHKNITSLTTNNLKHVKVSDASLNVLFLYLSVSVMCRTHHPDDELSSELMVQDKRQKQEASSIEEELLLSHRLLVRGGGEEEKSGGEMNQRQIISLPPEHSTDSACPVFSTETIKKGDKTTRDLIILNVFCFFPTPPSGLPGRNRPIRFVPWSWTCRAEQTAHRQRPSFRRRSGTL